MAVEAKLAEWRVLIRRHARICSECSIGRPNYQSTDAIDRLPLMKCTTGLILKRKYQEYKEYLITSTAMAQL